MLAIGLVLGFPMEFLHSTREDRSVSIWLRALAIQAVFWILFVNTRQAGPLISAVLVNTLSLLAMVEYLRAIREFLGRPHYQKCLYSLVLAVAATNFWFSIVTPDYAIRVASVSVPGALLMLWIAGTLLRHAEPGIARPMRVYAAVFLITAVSLLVRWADVLLDPGKSAAESTPQQIALLVYAFFPVFFSIGFLLMQTMRASARLEMLASIDDLTGMLNRRAFRSTARHILAGCQRADRNASLLLLDLDHFKQINDFHGHEAGDLVLREFCRIVQHNLRGEDAAARIGGEEFAVLLPGTDRTEALIPAERIRKGTENLRLPYRGHDLKVTVSIGISQWSGETLQIEPLLREADRQLYMAKQSGRNRIASGGDQDPSAAAPVAGAAQADDA